MTRFADMLVQQEDFRPVDLMPILHRHGYNLIHQALEDTSRRGAACRQECAFAMKTAGIANNTIARMLGYDHSTVIYSFRQVKHKIKSEPKKYAYL